MSVERHSYAIDVLRIVAAHAIVAHHLAIYTSMADAAWPLAPELFRWFADHARKAVQVFLVVGGFLAARSLLPMDQGVAGAARERPRQPMVATRRIVSRFLRLAPMVWLALLAITMVEAFVGMAPGDAAPAGALRMIANALLLHDVLGVPSMSAGLWYVAIDLQLFACAVVLASFGPRSPRAVLGCVVAAVLASAWFFNRHAGGDAFAPYFMASYGLGMLAAWAVGPMAPQARAALLAASVGVVLALTVDFRDRLVLACVSAWLLVAMHRGRSIGPGLASTTPGLARALRRQAGATYALFLLHYPVALLVDAWWPRVAPSTPSTRGAGLIVAWLASWALAMVVHRWVEPRITPR
jgi:peptidoglycan/LPS O-acetylase OafA/YrhL